MSGLQKHNQAHHAAPARWLSIVGIGEDGLDGLSAAAKRLINDAELVIGGRRQLDLAETLVRNEMVWPSPLLSAVPEILAKRGRPICVLASGDPFSYGIGATLAAHIPAEEMLCLPAPSAFSLAANHVAWPLQTTVCVSLHGRPLEHIIPHLQPGARILALSWDARTPMAVSKLLCERGMPGSQITVMERLGGPNERVRTASAEQACFEGCNALNILAIEIKAGLNAVIIPRAQGLSDDMFEHEGQITKREVRAITLSSLAPRTGELLWDIGAGSGSISVEWMLSDTQNRAIAIELRDDRAALCARNAAALGVPSLRVVKGSAPVALDGLETPDAIFIGGGASDAVLAAAIKALRVGGRLVANAVTLETESRLVAQHAQRGGSLTQIAISRAEPLGSSSAWRPAMTVTQWVWTKT